MHFLQTIFVVSGFVGGLSLSLFPEASNRNGSHAPIWTFGIALATYLVFMAICLDLPNFPIVLLSSLTAAAAAFACGLFFRKPDAAAQLTHEFRTNSRDMHA